MSKNHGVSPAIFVPQDHEISLWEEPVLQPTQSDFLSSWPSSVLRNSTIIGSHQPHPTLSSGLLGPPRSNLEKHICPLWSPVAYPQMDLELLCLYEAGPGWQAALGPSLASGVWWEPRKAPLLSGSLLYPSQRPQRLDGLRASLASLPVPPAA